MNNFKKTLTINANIEITPKALEAIVLNTKAVTGKNEKNVFKVDTADKVSEIISLFLDKKDFESFAKNIKHYY